MCQVSKYYCIPCVIFPVHQKRRLHTGALLSRLRVHDNNVLKEVDTVRTPHLVFGVTHKVLISPWAIPTTQSKGWPKRQWIMKMRPLKRALITSWTSSVQRNETLWEPSSIAFWIFLVSRMRKMRMVTVLELGTIPWWTTLGLWFRMELWSFFSRGFKTRSRALVDAITLFAAIVLGLWRNRFFWTTGRWAPWTLPATESMLKDELDWILLLRSFSFVRLVWEIEKVGGKGGLVEISTRCDPPSELESASVLAYF